MGSMILIVLQASRKNIGQLGIQTLPLADNFFPLLHGLSGALLFITVEITLIWVRVYYSGLWLWAE